MQRTQENLLSPRKMSVSRMHSLPNDSYMFRPVRPASAPYPLQEAEPTQAYLELGTYYFSVTGLLILFFCVCVSKIKPNVRRLNGGLIFYIGSVTSIHSQPCDGHSLLQVPGVHPQPHISICMPRIPTPKSSPLHVVGRPLHRQVHLNIAKDFCLSNLYYTFHILLTSCCFSGSNQEWLNWCANVWLQRQLRQTY